MSENQNTNPQPDKDSADLMKELREMGQQLEAAFRAAIESDRAKQLQKDIAQSVTGITWAFGLDAILLAVATACAVRIWWVST